MPATIKQLAEELRVRISSITEFEDRGWYIFNLDETKQEASAGYPAVFISYNGANIEDTTANTGTMMTARMAQFLTLYFQVIIAVEYKVFSGINDLAKDSATDMLESVRNQVLGYHGVNKRPWRLVREEPLQGEVIEGVIMYGQLWSTQAPYKSNPS